jgi:methionine synthase I (cobalamin-dependent)
VREAIGYWRVQPVVSDSTNDAAAIARATTKARERRTRAGALASCADRYASVDAQAVEQDQARVACQLAARELFKDGADMVPATTREQIEAIAAACSGE